MNDTKAAIFGVSLLGLILVFALGRFFILPEQITWPGIYKAFAHLLVGFLGGVWVVTRSKIYLYLFLFLCAVELIAFGLGRLV